MGNVFRFKQFSIRHDKCAMKVGTDGVLLGAWGSVGGSSILDIGTGTGLIALMSAQRNPEAEVFGIDIDEAAACQAKENFEASPFGTHRLHSICGDILSDNFSFMPDKFDAILCNPPFFTEDTLPSDKGRALARNSKSLPFPSLVGKVASLLADEGTFSVILPSQTVTEFVGLCLSEGLHLMRRMSVQTTARKLPRRALLAFTKRNVACHEETLVLMNSDGSRSLAYQELTTDFYLEPCQLLISKQQTTNE